MSTKKGVKKVQKPNRVLTIVTFGFVIAALPIFILLSFYAYSLVFLGTDGVTIAKGVTILVLMIGSLGFVLLNRR